MAFPLKPSEKAPREFIAEDHGTCENCGSEDVDICCIPGYMWLCEDCYIDLDWCDICGEPYVDGAVEFVELDDGRRACPYCAEEYGIGEAEE